MDPSQVAPSAAGPTGGLVPAASAQPEAPAGADYEVNLVSLNQWQLAWRRFKRHRLALIGSFIFLAMCAIGILGPILVPYDPLAIPHFVKGCGSGCGPNLQHPFGTTGGLQHDVFAITVNGARLSLLIGVGASFFSTVIGTTIGGVAGYFGGWIDNLLMRIVDVLLSLPLLFVILVVAKFLGAGNWVMIMLVFAIFGWAGLARLVRSLFLTLREEVFVEAARAVGVSDLRIIFRHILPNAVSPIIVATTLSVAGVIITEAFVSYLGFGVDPNTPTWGNALNSSQNTLPAGNWWHPFFPGIAIVLTVVGINFMGDGLRDALDPRSRE